jgi:hypothetical protein
VNGLCKGRSLGNRDTALSDNFLQYLVAVSAEPGSDATVTRVVDATGRLVGYAASGDLDSLLGADSLPFYVTCIDDH